MGEDDGVLGGEVRVGGVVHKDGWAGGVGEVGEGFREAWGGGGDAFEFGQGVGYGDCCVVLGEDLFVATADQDETEVDWGVLFGEAGLEEGQLAEESLAYTADTDDANEDVLCHFGVIGETSM